MRNILVESVEEKMNYKERKKEEMNMNEVHIKILQQSLDQTKESVQESYEKYDIGWVAAVTMKYLLNDLNEDHVKPRPISNK